MDINIFNNLPIDLKGDYTFQKGTFIDSRIYGFLKIVLYKTDKLYIEVT